MNGFIALFAVDFAKIGIEMNNGTGTAPRRAKTPH